MDKMKEEIIKTKTKIVGQHNKISFYDEKGILQRVEFYVGNEQVGFMGRTDIGEDKILKNKCKFCGGKLSDSRAFCDECGRDQDLKNG